MSVNIKKNGTLTKLAGLYANINLRLSQLLDTDISSLEDGQILVYNNETSKWENQEAPAGVEVVDNLTTQSATSALSANQGYVLNNALAGKANAADVLPTLITSPANKQILSYDSSSSKWVNSVNGNTVLLGTADPAANLGKEGDLYVKLSSPSYGNSYRIHTRSTGGESASIDVDTIADGAVVATQNINYHWPVQTFPDFSTNYKSSNWTVTITSNNVYGRAQGSTISWPYYQTNDVTLTINPPSVYAIFVKSRGIWIQIGKSPVENFAELKDTNFNNLQNGQLAVYNSTTGKWENQTPNFSDKFVITMTWDEELEDYVLDKTPTEVIDAYNSGYYITAKTPNTEDEDHFYTLAYFKNDNNELQLGFNQATTYDSLHGDELIYNSLTSETIRLKSEDLNTWEVTYSYLDLCRLEAVIYKDNNVYHCDESPSVFQDIVGLPGGILELVDISDRQVNWGGVKYTLSKIDDNEVYYFTSSEVNSSNELSVKTFVMTPNNTYSDWASIVKYESSSGGSSSDILILKLSEDEETGDIVCDKTPSEVLAAYQAGTLLFLLDTRYDELYLFDNYDDYDDYYHMLFSRCETSYTGLIMTVTYDLTSSEDEDVWDDIDYDSTDLEFNHAEISLSNGSYSCSISPTKMNISLQYRSSLGVFLKYTEDDTVYNVSYVDFTNDVYHFSAVIKDASNNFKLRTFVLTASGNSWGSIIMNEIPIVDSTSVIKWSDAKTSVKKNLLKNEATTTTIHGITFTVNSDGSITANGTATAEGANLVIYRNENESCPYNGCILSGCPSGGSGSKYDLRVSDITTGSTQDYGNGATISLSDTGKWNASILIRAYQEVSNLVFRPMIRLSTIENDTYVPYIPDNIELNEQKVSWDDTKNSIKKNYAYSINNCTVNDVTFTTDFNGVVNANGTASSSGGRLNIVGNSFMLPAGTYKLVTEISDASITDALLTAVVMKSSDNTVLRNAVDKRLPFTLSEDTLCYVGLNVVQNTVYSNVKIKFMVCLASVEDDTYVPYIPDNTELVRYTDNNILGAKNLFNSVMEASTNLGVSLTYNADGSIKLNGTNSSSQWDCYFILSMRNFKAGTYIISQGVTSNKAFLQIKKNSYSGAVVCELSTYSNLQFKLDEDTKLCIVIRVAPNAVLSNLVLYPMIRFASDTDSQYIQYAPTNSEIYNYIKNTSSLGTKNLLENKCVTSTSNGVTFTVNADKSITINGTNDGTASSYALINTDFWLKKGVYRLSGMPLDYSGGFMKCQLLCQTYDGQSLTWADAGRNGEYKIKVLTEDTRIRCIIQAYENQSFDNMVVKPMITHAEIPYDGIDDYVPYCMSVSQLTEKVNTYLEQTTTTSTSANTIYTFTDARITANSTVDVYTNIFGVSPSNIVLADGSCTVTFPAQSSAQSMTCKIYIK